MATLRARTAFMKQQQKAAVKQEQLRRIAAERAKIKNDVLVMESNLELFDSIEDHEDMGWQLQ